MRDTSNCNVGLTSSGARKLRSYLHVTPAYARTGRLASDWMIDGQKRQHTSVRTTFFPHQKCQCQCCARVHHTIICEAYASLPANLNVHAHKEHFTVYLHCFDIHIRPVVTLLLPLDILSLHLVPSCLAIHCRCLKQIPIPAFVVVAVHNKDIHSYTSTD